MTRKRRQRGGALIYVTVMSIAITSVVVAGAELSLGAVQAQSKFEESAKVRYAMDGAVAYAMTLHQFGQLAIPSTVNVSIGDLNMSVECTDAGAPPRTFRAHVTTNVNGTTYTETRFAGKRVVPSVWNFAAYARNSLSLTGNLTTGSLGANGDVYFGANAGGSNNHTINGDLECTGSIDPTRYNVTGTAWSSATTVNKPTASSATYLLAPNVTPFLFSSINGHTFSDLAGNHQVLHRTGNLDLRGTFTGRGVIFVDGAVTLSSNVTYGSADSRLVVIATGNIDVSNFATTVNGFYFAGNRFRVQSSAVPRTLASGAIVCDELRIESTYMIQHDPLVWNDPSQGHKLRMPGHWP